MEFFSEKTHFDFIGARFKSFAVFIVVVVGSLIVLAVKGFNYSIDFVGGSVVQLTYETPVEIGALRKTLESAGFPDAIPQRFTGTDAYQIRLKSRGEDQDATLVEEFLKKLAAADPAAKFRVDSQEFVGPTVGAHLFKQASFAIFFCLLGIVIYVGFRFANPVWGVAGVIALAHDVLATAGLVSLLGLEFDLTLVAGLLTLAGYSINDTIVIFDRIRERLTMNRREPLDQLLNISVNETLSRTIITSGLVFITVVTLLLFGGAVIHDFALCMTFGVFVGSYSTIAVATPMVYEWETRRGGARPALAEPVVSAGGGKPHGKHRRG
ncbi:MAG: protein translocase subunit SecF [Elusimicrobia bacterium]|nr:protein translocase subunit SecF [Elusimicrobiota bacterium]